MRDHCQDEFYEVSSVSNSCFVQIVVLKVLLLSDQFVDEVKIVRIRFNKVLLTQ